jgi:hypothetical protein
MRYILFQTFWMSKGKRGRWSGEVSAGEREKDFLNPANLSGEN